MVLEAEPDRIPFFKQYASVIILITNIAFFVWQLTDPSGYMHIYEAAFVPAEFFAGQKLWTIFTSMFMHGDYIHIIMNMWFFLVITDNCEHAMGHILYLITYFASGIFATLLHALSTLIPVYGPIAQFIPSLGASGAIFGLMAVYAILYPKNKFYLPTGTIMRKVNASYFIITYFIAELTYAFFSFELTGTAHFAHVGGFVAGAIIALIFKAIKGSSYKEKPK